MKALSLVRGPASFPATPRVFPRAGRWAPVAAAALILAACGRATGPAPLDTANDSCAHCRMAVSDRHFAAQIVAPGEEPLFFDDIGCLRDFLKEAASLHEGAEAYVADHLTGDWVEAAHAIYTVNGSIQTPMASGLMAHADAGSRDRDTASKGGRPVTAAEVIGPLGRQQAQGNQ
jgi:copper chaperone NosL